MQSRRSRPGQRTRPQPRSSRALVALAILGITPHVHAIVRRHDISDSFYIALGNEAKYLTAVAVQDATRTTGTGVLISPKWILTAGHVALPSAFNGAPVTINIGGTSENNGTSYGVIQSFSPYTGTVSSGTDIGLAQLGSNVSGIVPVSRWFTLDELSRIGTYVGFGDPGTGLSGPGGEVTRQKRGMHNVLSATGGSISYSNNTILSDFDDPGNADGYNAWGSSVPEVSHPLEGLVAGGDSGGPVYIDNGSRWYVGAISGFVVALQPPNGNGGNPNSNPPGFPLFKYADVNGATRVTAHNIWIDDNITNTWKTATTGSFGTGSNWSVGTFTSGTPGAGDLAGFNVAGSYTVTFGSSVANHMLLARQGNVTLDLNSFTYNLTSNMFEGAMVVGRYGGNNATLTLRNGMVNASSDVTVGHLVGSNGRLQIGPNATLNVASSMFVGGNYDQSAGIGRLVIQDPSSAVHVAGTLKIWNNGTVHFDDGTLTAGAIQIEQQGSLLLAPGGDKIVRTGSLTVAPFAAVDLSDNDLLIDYVTSPDATIREYLLDGRIFSSAATPTLGLGYADNQLLGRTIFDGLSVGPANQMVKFTYLGDADLDGDVDKGDLTRLANNWQTATPVWIAGDFNYDGVIDVRDLYLMSLNWLLGVGDPIGPEFGSALTEVGLPQALAAAMVPEPGVVSLALAAPLLLRRRRRIA